MPPTDIAPGLWIWRLRHPDWTEESGWEPHVTSTVIETGGEVALIDPLAPPDIVKRAHGGAAFGQNTHGI